MEALGPIWNGGKGRAIRSADVIFKEEGNATTTKVATDPLLALRREEAMREDHDAIREETMREVMRKEAMREETLRKEAI